MREIKAPAPGVGCPPSGASCEGQTAQAWYWVKVTYKAILQGHPRKRHLWERTIFLIRGPAGLDVSLLTEEQAARLQQRAEEVARAKEHEYVGATGITVRWVLQEIERIESVIDREFEDGTEVYWELFHRVDRAPE